MNNQEIFPALLAMPRPARIGGGMERAILKKSSRSAGFTLIEVCITLGILTTMMVAITTILKSSFDVRFALGDEAKLTHRINVAMQKITDDISHSYIISSKDTKRNYNDRTSKTIFRIDKVITGGDKISFTTMNHQPLKYNSHEGDSAYVVYEVQDAKESPGRKHLFRGAMAKIPEDFKEDPAMEMLASHIKSINFEFWNGDGWSKDKWTSERGDTKDLMPHLVKVMIEAWSREPAEDGQVEEGDGEVISYSSVVFLTNSSIFKELKSRPSTPKT
jgi:type II secretory pathway pseudopilin PulG